MNRSVLIVDDDAGLRQMMEEALHSAGYDVFTTATGRDAIELQRTHDIRVAFIDVVMPGMSGLELCRRLTAQCSECRLFAMSGFNAMFDASENTETPFDSESCLAAGFDEFFTKPIRLDTILHATATAFIELEPRVDEGR